MKNKKLFATVLTLCCLLSIATTITVLAADENFAYSFTMKADCGESYCDTARLRDTDNTHNPWKVDFRVSGEGENTIAYYWIASSFWHQACSNRFAVKCDSNPYYFPSYADKGGTNVKLGVQNNNDVSNSYIVSGYWDEEIGEIFSDDELSKSVL